MVLARRNYTSEKHFYRKRRIFEHVFLAQVVVDQRVDYLIGDVLK